MSIITDNQKKLLLFIANEKTISDKFYLSGGTALSEYYLKHRLSEDLDFFSESEFEPFAISAFFKKIQNKAGITSFEFEQSFNRNLFFLKLSDDLIKTEFTYFPFPNVEKAKEFGGVKVDSLIDIAVNKIFTIYQNPRSRDFVDLYFILQAQKSWNIDILSEKTQVKFDTFIEPLQLSAQFTKATTLKDYPRMVSKTSDKKWQNFFLSEAKRLAGKQIG
ncbi:MAG: nucleotidyl transferase AbiEii/AbiGii toxin family protein [bacterium]|nr:nucleotidyl transferase AbiEii/AbiGii toxin family protein [bacterium]